MGETVRYRFVGASLAGNAEIAAMTPETHAERMRDWESRIADHLGARFSQPCSVTATVSS